MAGFENQLSNVNTASTESSTEPSAPWRASYNDVAPIAVQALTNTSGQAGEAQTGQSYSNGYSNVGGESPIYYAQPSTTTTTPYDAGTYGQAPEGVGETGTYANSGTSSTTGQVGERTPSQFSPTTNTGDGSTTGNTSTSGSGSDTPGGMNGNTYGYSPYQGGSQSGGTTGMPTGDTSSGSTMKPDVDGISATIYGAGGALLGKFGIPKVANPIADHLLGTSSYSGPSLFDGSSTKGLTGMFNKVTGPNGVIPQSWKDRFNSAVGGTGSADGATDAAGATGAGSRAQNIFNTVKDTATQGATYDATQYQNHFNTQYANRLPYQGIVDSDNKIIDGLDEKTAAGGTLTAEQQTQLGDATARRTLLTDPADLTKVNPKLFDPAEGPSLVGDLKADNPLGLDKSPFSESQLELIGKQSKFIDSATADVSTAATTAEDKSIWSRPGVSTAARGAALLFGSTLANDYVDSKAGSENALHFGNYGIAAGWMAGGDNLVSKLGFAAGAAGLEYGLDKVLPATSHVTISNLMAPTKFDALMQGAALTLPSDGNVAKLSAMGAAWTEGRLANMSFLPSVITTGAAGTATAFLMKDPEMRAGALTLEAGAWGVSRLMHAFDK